MSDKETLQITSKITCNNTLYVVCPYCWYEHKDSWELSADSWQTDCSNCDKPFNYYRDISVTYSTKK